jgi:2-succinyl-6-hydroxy-2,4-cyclohexadiene-1-carboxylate synthase
LSGWAEARAIEIAGLSYGVRLTQAVDAARPTIAMLHGFSGSSEDWTETAAALQAAGFTAIGIDLPGHGLTGIPASSHRFTMPETARDLAALITTLGIARAHWLGYSMGGRVALYLGVTEPARVASLILESTSPGIAEEPARKERRARDEALATEIGSRGIPWFVNYWESLPIFASQRGLSEEARNAQHARRLRNSAAGLAGSLRGLGQGMQEFLGPRLGSIRCPALLLAGALDPEYTALAQRMAAAIPDAEVVLVPDAGHNIHLEQPGAFRRAILDRLRRVGAAPRPEASLPA